MTSFVFFIRRVSWAEYFVGFLLYPSQTPKVADLTPFFTGQASSVRPVGSFQVYQNIDLIIESQN